MVIVSGQVLSVNEQVMVLVKLPELAVDNIKVLVAEIVCDLVYVLFVLDDFENLQKVGFPQLG